jgi:RHS repeat-associated protein
MSNKSGIEGVISLPSGGGALQGLGESFAPDLFTGTGNLSVPIAVPSGRRGMQPQLALSYSTGGGNGPFGLGWHLSGAGVSRKTSSGIPTYGSSIRAAKSDTFTLSGAEDLVPVGATSERTDYRPRTEGLFAKIIHHHGVGSDYWEVRTKDGLTSIHGTPQRAGDDPAAIADPARRGNVFAWHLTEARDVFGNRVVYEYERDLRQEGAHFWDQLYLRRIRYIDYTDSGGETRFLAAVELHYEDRPDPFSSCRSGFEIRTTRRCTRIETRVQDQLVRVYHLVYLDRRPEAADSLPANGVSLLSQIRVTGHASDTSEELPPLEISYSPFAPQGRSFFPLQGTDLPPRSLAHPEFELADLFGRGLPDILQMNGVVRYWRNRGSGEYDAPREMSTAPAGLNLGDAGVQMLDANGDGRIDLMVTALPVAGYFPLSAQGGWDGDAFRPYRLAPTFNLADRSVRLLDLDGDGVTDALHAGARFEYFFNDARTGWGEARTVERQRLDEFPDVQFTDSRVRLADLSGDGLLDILLVYDGNIEYWPNLGHGRWGKRQHMQNSPRFPSGYDARRILIGDVDGDGVADLVYVDHREIRLYINQSGNRWSDAIVIEGTPPVTDMDAVRLADMLGSGVGGILWSMDAGTARDSLLYLDLIGGRKPYLLTEMNNHRGALTRVAYESSMRFYMEDQEHHATRWKTSLPFPVQVVSRVEIVDEISLGKRTVDYSYHHGHYDGAEREFRGFGRVDQRDTQTFEDYHASTPGTGPFASVAPEYFAPPVLTKTWFHQGPIGEEFGAWQELDLSNEYWSGDPEQLRRPQEQTDFLTQLPRRVRRDALRTLRGTQLRSELYALDGSTREARPYTVIEALHGLRHEFGPTLAPTLSEVEGFFPHLIARRTTQWERGDEPLTHFDFASDYDAVGQSREQISIACPRGFRHIDDVIPDTTPFIASCTRTLFAQTSGDSLYIQDRPARVTSFELRHVGSKSVRQLLAGAANLTDESILTQVLTYYDGAAFEGLPLQQLGSFGVAVRTETLAFTEAILERAHAGAVVPPYLKPGEAPPWTSDYPQRFRQLPELAGYVFHDGSGPQTRGFFINEGVRFDFHGGGPSRGLALTRRSALGQESHVSYDEFALLPLTARDSLGLERQVQYDYRVLQPRLAVDPNGNRTQFTFSPLGFITSVTAMGKEGEAVGDTPAAPSTRVEYDFMAFANSPVGARRPIFVRTLQRDYHVHDANVPSSVADRLTISVEFADGFGRVIQQRALAQEALFGSGELGADVISPDQSIAPGASRARLFSNPDAPAVVVTGTQVFDNKGQVVEQYEPFFSTGFEYAPAAPHEHGRKAQMSYDPRGQLVRTRNPDGSLKRVIFGIPPQLDNPDDYEPTPWEAYTYDANDLAQQFVGDHHVDPSHFNTPASVEIDALGRVIKSITRRSTSDVDAVLVHTRYDARGNAVEIIDALGRTVVSRVHDLTGSEHQSPRLLREDSMDSGTRRIVFDASGNEIERRDSKGALTLQAYDIANRPTHLWARDAQALPITLRQMLIYGDNAALADAAARNLKGHLYQHFDEAGLMEIAAFDFKGNILRQRRQVLSDAELLSKSNGTTFAPYQVDWEIPGQRDALDPKVYQTDTLFDARNRVRHATLPEDVTGDRKELVPSFARNGALESLRLLSQGGAVEETIVAHVAYNARGQRTLIAYGNGLMTRYAHDPGTFQVARMRSERYVKEGTLDFVPAGGLLQDVAYERDLVGNITRMRDRSPGTGIPNSLLGNDALDRVFGYDSFYRLISATGREHDLRNPSSDPWLDEMLPTNQDATRTRPYTRTFEYDDADSLIDCRHVTPNGSGDFRRRLIMDPASNRCVQAIQGNAFAHTFDANGNMLTESTSRHFHWNHSDRLLSFRIQAGSGPASLEAVYAYDATGSRVRKVIRRQNGSVTSVTYIGNGFEHQRQNQEQNTTLHVWDALSRVMSRRIGPALGGDESPATQYVLEDQIHDSRVVLDGIGAFVRREEFYPYGGTSFGGFARKRYRFTGKERDEESGLSYHRARYYAPSLARWISPDPAGTIEGLNLYRYGQNNPLRFFDDSGNSSASSYDHIGYTNYNPFESWDPWPAPPAGDSWYKKAAIAVYHGLKAGVKAQWWASKQPALKTWEAMKLIAGKAVSGASTIWNAAKNHPYIAGGIGIGVALALAFAGKYIWNYALAPTIRVATNAAFGYVMFGNYGAIAGALMGAVHGFAMAKAESYDWGSWKGWLAFTLDNTWSLFNSFVGSAFATANIGHNPIDDGQSKNSNTLYFKGQWFSSYDTTLGNVTVGTNVPAHEKEHAWQARLFGPIYIPGVIASFEVATVLPYWLLYGNCSVTGFWTYFSKGVYPNTLHELDAYRVQGNPC